MLSDVAGLNIQQRRLVRMMETKIETTEFSSREHCNSYQNCHPNKTPEDERYRLKHIFLREKYEHVMEASTNYLYETNRIRHRVYQIEKQCRQMRCLKRVLCQLLDDHGDLYYKAHLEILDEDPPPTFLDALPKESNWTMEPARKKSKTKVSTQL
uniref:NSL complex protein NSL2 n=1 Tax=Heterorhabditis bacteriophora TaxID=37862 RepID=A0A1I7WU42_HETBA